MMRKALILQIAIPVAAAIVAVPVGMSVAQDANDDQTVTELIKEKRAEAVANGTEPDLPLKADGSTDMDAIRANSIPATDCPEVLAYFSEPRIAAYYRWFGGDVPDEHHYFYLKCPDLGMLQSQTEQSIMRNGWTWSGE